MNKISMKAYAKINLSLDVIGKQADGYHQVEMIMHQVNLYDTVTVGILPLNTDGDAIEVSTNQATLLTDRTNLAYKAAELMKNYYNKAGRITIHLDKKIPIAAGLAGGSADAAAVLLALSQLWELDLELQELLQLAVKLGADVPFCVMGQAYKGRDLRLRGRENASSCALAEGIGEILTPLPPLQSLILITKPSIAVSTAEVYGNFRMEQVAQHPNTRELMEGLKEKNLNKIQKNMINVLEIVTLSNYPEVLRTKQEIEALKTAYQVLMSGSGPTIFALYTNREKAKNAYINSRKKNEETYLIRTLS